MWRKVILTICFSILIPSISFADTKPVFSKPEDAANACVKKLLQTHATSTNKAASTENSDKCISDKITIDNKGNKSIKPTSIILPNVPLTTDLEWCVPNACNPVNQPNKCGTITYETPSLTGGNTSQESKISKCDPTKQNLVGSFGSNPKGYAAQAIASAAINNIKSPDGTINSDKLSQVLQNLGVDQSTANDISKDPTKQNDAYDMLQKLASGDQQQINEAQTIAKDQLGITLNPDTVSQISSLQPEGFKTLVDGVTTDQQKQSLDSITSGQGTFKDETAQQQQDTEQGGTRTLSDGNACGYGGIAGSMMYSETRCGKLTAPAGQSAQGPLQYQCATWQSYANATGHSDWSDCSNRYDPTKAAQVTNDYYQNVWAPKLSAQCTGSGYTISACAYSYHWLGSGDYNRITQGIANGTIDPNASFTSLCGTVVSSGVCSQNPGLVYANSQSRTQPYTVNGVFQHLDTLMGGSGSNAPTTYQGSTNSFTSPFSSFGGTTPYTLGGSTNALANSPFSFLSGSQGTMAPQTSYQSPTYSGGGYTSPTIQSQPTQYPTQYPNSGIGQVVQPNQNQVTLTPINTSAQQTLQQLLSIGGNSTYAQPAYVLPAGQVIVTPLSVRVGSRVGIIWSSTGMSSSNQCTVTVGGIVQSTANEGSTSLVMNTPGSIPIALHCIVASSGATFDRSTSVTVSQ